MEHQYRTITSGAGWTDRSGRGKVKFAGPDALSFLQALVTNDVSALSEAEGIHAAYLTPQGRMIADLDVFHRGSFILVAVGDGLGPALTQRFDSLIFSEDLAVTDVTRDWIEMAVTGAAAAAVVGAVTGIDQGMLLSRAELHQVAWADGFVARTDESPFPMFRVFAAADRRDVLMAALDAAGAVALSDDLVRALRIEAGRPLWGVDLTTETIPLEAGLLDRAISTTKGCYVGQEIVIRILHRGGGRVARRLVTFAMDEGGSAVPPGTAIAVDGKDVGHATSVAFAPSQQRVIGLGYVHRDVAEVGRSIVIGDGAAGQITGFAR